jgi:hypothetical protein
MHCKTSEIIHNIQEKKMFCSHLAPEPEVGQHVFLVCAGFLFRSGGQACAAVRDGK